MSFARGKNTSAASSSDTDLPPTEWAQEYRQSFDSGDSDENGALATFLTDCGEVLGGVETRFIVIGDAILETVVPFPKSPRFAVLGKKGTCATFASQDKTFEAHLFLSTIKAVTLARVERGGRKIYAVRFFGETGDDKSDVPVRPKLTCLLHSGENGEVPPSAVEAWEKLAGKLK